MGRRVLVTGGAGFIGRYLVQQLIESGETVRVLDRCEPSQDVEWIPGDIRDRETVRRAVQGCPQVYHLAANPQLWTKRRGYFHQVNYLGTVHVLGEAIRAGAERILHTSTESILTRAKQTTPIAEDQPITRQDVIGPYCLSKWRAEEEAFRLARLGHPILIVNPTLPIGPGDWGRSPPTQMILDFCLGKRPAYLDADLNLIDVRDVADGMIRCMTQGQFGRRYLLGAENWSIQKVFQHLAQCTGLPEPRWRVPYPVALITAYISEFWAYLVTHQIPAATITGVKLTQRKMHFDASWSLTELDLKPRSIAQSLTETVQWFEQQGMIQRHGGSAFFDQQAV